jgi:excisionase family DNA binding protein
MDKLISVKEAAARLSCAEASIWKWLGQGKLQRVKVGRLTRIREQDIESIIRLGLQP